MLLKQLTLNNFCQHRKLQHVYRQGVTGITGGNGKGKTNFLDAGQYFALTGKTPEGVRKEDLVNWSSSKGNTELVFTHAGVEYTLIRMLQSSRVSLQFADQELRNAEANACMEELIGMKPELFYETCWVSQGNLWKVVMMTHAERMHYFQKITGMLRAETLRGILQEEGVNKLPLYVDRTTEMAEIAVQLIARDEQCAKLRTQAAELKTLEEAFAGQLSAAQLIIGLPSAEEVANRREAQEAIVLRQQKRLREFRAGHQLEERPEVEPPSAKDMQAEADHARLPKFKQELLGQQQELRDATCKLAGLLAVEPAELTRAQNKKVNLTSGLQQLRKDLKLAEQGRCPTCGHPWEGASSTELKKEEQETALALQAADKELRELQDAHTAYERQNSRLSAVIQQLQTAIADKQRQLADVQYAETFDTAAYEARKTAYAEYQRFLQQANRQREELKALEDAVREAQYALQQVMETRTADVEQRQAAATLIANARALNADILQNASALAAAETESRNLRQQQNRYAEEQRRNARVQQVRCLFERSRELLHREQLPKLVMSHTLVKLNRHLDRFVQFFDLPFTAEINEDFDFVVHYAVKSNVPASRASGGQKVALSIAYHLAWAEALAGSVPLMVLDEPTNHLDESHRRQIREVLQKIQAIADKGTVFMVATHDPILFPAFTRRVDMDIDRPPDA